MEQGVRHHGCLGPSPSPQPGTLEQQGSSECFLDQTPPRGHLWAKTLTAGLLPEQTAARCRERVPRRREVGELGPCEWEEASGGDSRDRATL